MKTINSILLACMLLFSSYAFAAITITGKVLDNGVGKAQAIVYFTDSATNLTDTAVTNQSGCIYNYP